MAREIKFRGIYEGDLDKHEQWVYGSLLIEGDTWTIVNYEGGLVSGFTVNPETVGEYTGLRDKSGVEICEGDIVTAHMFSPPYGDDKDIQAIVVFEDFGFIFKWTTRSGDTTYCLPHETSHFEEPCIKVIGNIHQNPELLDKEVS